LSIIHHAASDGIKFIARKPIDFAFHVRLLLFDEATVRIVWFGRLGVGLVATVRRVTRMG
jgi:hypothetical protein